MHVPVVSSDRLDLVSMSPEFLRRSLARDRRAARVIGASLPQEWPDVEHVLFARLIQLEADPGLQPWLLRAIVLRAERSMVGHIGFHTPPDPEYLRPLVPGGVELGYTIFSGERRQGYAREACTALLDWARASHGVERFVLSISPSNAASLGLAHALGFRCIGAHEDDHDGPEDVFALGVS